LALIYILTVKNAQRNAIQTSYAKKLCMCNVYPVDKARRTFLK